MIGNSPIDDLMDDLLNDLEADLSNDIALGEMELQIDESLEVLLSSEQGDVYEESHVHTLPAMDVVMLHLRPTHAQQFDAFVRQFADRHELAGDTDQTGDPHEGEYCVVCGAEPSAEGPGMHPVSSIEDGCVCTACVGGAE